jgi:hypothetical protein
VATPDGVTIPCVSMRSRSTRSRERPPNSPYLSGLFHAVLELAVVLGLVVVALRLGDEPVVIDRPLIVSEPSSGPQMVCPALKSMGPEG